MSNTLLSPLPSLRLSDHDIPPATATLCRWHPQPRPRPPKTQILQHAGTGPTARTPTKLTDPATHSSRQFRPRAAKSRRTSPLNPHRPTLPQAHTPAAVSSFEAFRTPASVNPLAPVPGRHPKTLNVSGRSRRY